MIIFIIIKWILSKNLLLLNKLRAPLKNSNVTQHFIKVLNQGDLLKP